MGESDPRRRSGATPNVDLHEQIVAAIQLGMERYQRERDTVDIKMLDRLRDDMNDGFNRVNGRLDAMDSRFGQGTSRFAVQEVKMARAEQDIAELKRTSTTERQLVVQAVEKEADSDEHSVVSNKFTNAIWLGIAGSIGVGITILAGIAFKSVEPAPKADPPATVSPPVTPASPRAAIPPNPPAPAAP
jgi:hypothetical protein